MSIYAGVTVRYNAYYGQGSGYAWLRNVQCKLKELNKDYLIVVGNIHLEPQAVTITMMLV